MDYRKILFLTGAVAIVAVVYALMIATTYLWTCLDFPGDYGV